MEVFPPVAVDQAAAVQTAAVDDEALAPSPLVADTDATAAT